MILHISHRLEVLIVANAEIAQQVGTALDILHGRITVAENEQALMSRLWERLPDVIVLGALAEHDSITSLCARIRQFLHTPILVVEQGADERTRIGWLDHGADDILLWSGTPPAELVARCYALMRRVQRQRRRDPGMLRLQALGMQLDIAERRLHLAPSRVLDLAPSQVRLLALFFSYGGGVVPTATLVLHQTGAPSESGHRSVSAAVRSLNRRLAHFAHPTPQIERVVGSGFRLTLIETSPPPAGPTQILE